LSDTLIIHNDGYIDTVKLMFHPSKQAMRVLVEREYRRQAEALDIQGNAPWVRWRRAMQGMKE